MKIVLCFVPPNFNAISSYAAQMLTDEQVHTKSRITLSSDTVRPDESVEVHVTGLLR